MQPETEPTIFFSLWRGPIVVRYFETMRDIAEGVCERHFISMTDLRRPDDGVGARRRPLAYARREFCALAYEAGRWSYPRIGRWLGGRDHTTILAAHRRYRERHPVPVVEVRDPQIGSNGGPPLEAWA